MNGKPPQALVLDAGPVIALAYRDDPDHKSATAGFSVLATRRTRLIAPLAVVCEVYKWLLYHAGPAVAHRALARMHHALDIVFSGRDDFDDATAIVVGLGFSWKGTMEDALVAALALRLRLPAWTVNYRDLSAFPRLELWTPGAS